MSIHPDLWDKILFYLSDEKTPCVKGEAFSVEQVQEGAEHILEGFDHCYKKPRPAPSSASTSFRSLPSAPPVKSEISEVLNAITMMGQNLQMVISASQIGSRTGPQGFPSQPVGQSGFSRQDRPRPGAGGKKCYSVKNRLIFSTIFRSYWSKSGPGRLLGMRKTWSCLAVETLFLLIQPIVHGPPELMSFTPGTRSCCLVNPPLISRRTLRQIYSRSKAWARQRMMAQIFLCTLNPSMRRKNNLAHLVVKQILIGPSSEDTLRYSRPDKMKCHPRRSKQIFQS